MDMVRSGRLDPHVPLIVEAKALISKRALSSQSVDDVNEPYYRR
jgi:hypothetical protein